MKKLKPTPGYKDMEFNCDNATLIEFNDPDEDFIVFDGSPQQLVDYIAWLKYHNPSMRGDGFITHRPIIISRQRPSPGRCPECDSPDPDNVHLAPCSIGGIDSDQHG